MEVPHIISYHNTHSVSSSAVYNAISALGNVVVYSVVMRDMNTCFYQGNKDYFSLWLNFQIGTYIPNAPTENTYNFFIYSKQIYISGSGLRVTQFAISNTGASTTVGTVWIRQGVGSSYDSVSFGSWVQVLDTRDVTSSVTSGSSKPVSSGGVYTALNGLIKYKDLSFTISANSWNTTSGGKLGKNLGNFTSLIGNYTTVLSAQICSFSAMTNYPFELYMDSDGANLYLTTTSQSASASIKIRVVYL